MGNPADGDGASGNNVLSGKSGPDDTVACEKVNRQPTFVVHLRAERGDGVRGLRAILKSLLRRHGFRCVSLKEQRE
jgi:hypothetical protein